ncbi:hypothetical protein COCSUDRAFT_67934 [Coccomyxa subellipsoidea C-169]|uniref:Methyltransferase domain-containing protein n=1 Tax=Coccomyxa subellipsoidea (strain C-169) TaxID=574566 RepID=I0YKV1_COCSC|nr:hypothetical protein COCSUDRAFT_67934 [Coccomyxa subellipsoidea C-169]EIE19020.1 hypothetical protein COCSUDRAFT_67934 [Coccomyxa subellipsoidea C-169]|eukprot:XP_005643564.1 hypothetical protein COCSUDRAFT_67934 [Coccomyxa subellipsoidea C-169]
MIAGNDGLKCGNAAGSQVRCPRTAIADGWHQLPSRQQLVTRFGLFKSQCTPEVAASGEVSCACEQCGRCRAFLQGRLDGGPTWRQYEVWTRDYINSLAAYLWRRGEELGLEHLAILEVGAGDGRLSAHLQAALAQLRPATSCCSVDLRCSDSGLCGLHECSPFRQFVELLSCEEALRKHRPDVVLCSWMPLGVDWTSSVRACPEVKEYVLIGEADGGICGHAVLTWGAGADRDRSSEPDEAWESEFKIIPSEKPCVPDGTEQSERTSGGAESPCAGGCTVKEQHWEGRGQLCDACCSSAREVVDGREDLPEQGQLRKRQRRTAGPEAASFVRVDLPELSRLQLCCTDERWLASTKSQTVSFRRRAC